MTKAEDDFEIVRGSGNIFRDMGEPDADVKQAKAILAARIIGIMDDRKLSTRQAGEVAGVDQSEFVRIRNARLDRFTIDRLMRIVNRLDPQVRMVLSDAPAQPKAQQR
ncbi:MAG: family transcriptional regulator [Geminicoccaceae bacterium]|jgi:predicted XRE-type DNA-binding protein|nr:family transcriptional regulator [Geminicoccaceae bacterium]